MPLVPRIPLVPTTIAICALALLAGACSTAVARNDDGTILERGPLSVFAMRVGDCFDDLLRSGSGRELAGEKSLHRSRDRVDVQVVKTGQHHAAVELDDLGVFPDETLQLFIGADGDDLAVGDGHRFGHAPALVDGVDEPAPENGVRGCRRRLGATADRDGSGHRKRRHAG